MPRRVSEKNFSNMSNSSSKFRDLFQAVAIFFKLSRSFSDCHVFRSCRDIYSDCRIFRKLSQYFSGCRVAWMEEEEGGKNRGNRVSRGITYLILKSESAPATVLIILNLVVVLREWSVPNSKFLNLISGRQGNHHFSVQMHVHHFYCKQITSI